MVKRVVDLDATYEIALGRKRAFGDERKEKNGFTLSRKNENRLAAARREGETVDDTITRILDAYEKQCEKDTCIFLS
jgi:macrodomain Ter protein organizer (MatP/YcbG family)